MKCEPIKQTSRPYEYGKGKEFESSEKAKEELEKKIQKIKTELALGKMWDHVKFDIVDIGNACQIVATIQSLVLFEEEKE